MADRQFLRVVYDRKFTVAPLPRAVRAALDAKKGLEGDRRTPSLPPGVLDEDDDYDDDDDQDGALSASRAARRRRQRKSRQGGSGGRREADAAAEAAQPPKLQVVLTKCDLVERRELARRVAVLKEELRDMDFLGSAAGRLPLALVSAAEGKGVFELQRELAALAVVQQEEGEGWEK